MGYLDSLYYGGYNTPYTPNFTVKPNFDSALSMPVFSSYTPAYTAPYTQPYTPYSLPTYSPSQSTSATSNSSTSSDPEKELKEAKKKRSEMYTQAIQKKVREYKEAGLSEYEKDITKEYILEQDKNAKIKQAGTVTGSLAGASIFASPQIIKAKKTGNKVVDICIKGNPGLWQTHPDLMCDAQEALRKLDSRSKKDLLYAKEHGLNTKNIVNTRQQLMREMRAAISSGNIDEIAKVTEKCNTAGKVCNGRFGRMLHRLGGQKTFKSREKVLNEALAAGKINPKPVKAGTSFLRNLGGLSGFAGGGVMVGLSFFMDRNKIKEAYKLDKKTGREQLKQTGIKSLISMGVWTAGDALGKTAAKKCLGKVVGRLAAKLAVKGGCKVLGSAIGSIVPGIGTIAGLVIGTVADWALSKFVFPKIFPNDALTKKQAETADDETLVQTLTERYMQGEDIGDCKMILERKLESDQMAEIQKVHNLDEAARAEYFKALQQQQEQAQAQEQQQAA